MCIFYLPQAGEIYASLASILQLREAFDEALRAARRGMQVS